MKSLLKPIQLVVCLAACTTALLLGAGCASSGYDKGNKAADNIQSTANSIAALPTHIDSTLASLDALVNKPQPDLRPQYKEFTTQMSGVESTAKEIAKARRAMGERSKEFFAAWDAQLAQINNEDIKARSEARKAEVNQRMQNIKRSYTEAEVAFTPFMNELKDVQKYLSVDLTAGGLAAIKEPVSRAKAAAVPLKTSIAKLAEDFKALGLAMSSVTPAAPAK